MQKEGRRMVSLVFFSIFFVLRMTIDFKALKLEEKGKGKKESEGKI